ncbi:MAG: 30S ribosomal protein S18 [Alphaproteobacteria bacterium]|nr:30S ribosomal protein S18 [Alphaproteobacteria bacterium]
MSNKKYKKSQLKLIQNFDYKNINFFKSFLTKQGKIKPRYETRLTAKKQRKLSKSIKRARDLNLLPSSNKNY